MQVKLTHFISNDIKLKLLKKGTKTALSPKRGQWSVGKRLCLNLQSYKVIFP